VPTYYLFYLHKDTTFFVLLLKNNQLKYIFVAEGRILVDEEGNLKRQYFMKDHLGNIQLTFDTNTNVLQEESYYHFGMVQNGFNYVNESLLQEDDKNKFLFNGKEKDKFTGYYEYGFRNYDEQLARWHVRDHLPSHEKDLLSYLD